MSSYVQYRVENLSRINEGTGLARVGDAKEECDSGSDDTLHLRLRHQESK